MEKSDSEDGDEASSEGFKPSSESAPCHVKAQPAAPSPHSTDHASPLTHTHTHTPCPAPDEGGEEEESESDYSGDSDDESLVDSDDDDEGSEEDDVRIRMRQREGVWRALLEGQSRLYPAALHTPLAHLARTHFARPCLHGQVRGATRMCIPAGPPPQAPS